MISFINELKDDNIFVDKNLFETILQKSIFGNKLDFKKYCMALKKKPFYPEFGYKIHPKNNHFSKKYKVF